MSKPLPVDTYVQGVLAGNRAVLAQAITLVESSAPRHAATAQAVLQAVLPHSGRSQRIGITGVPGAGKSTLIEALGMHLLAQGHRVAVLAVDPTSTRTGGSILGDKTRMAQLSKADNAFVRPSPTQGTLGGVARKTREAMLLCESAGFDVVLIETVGTGQSEVTVRSMVDFFMVLLITGAGDELQGIKKGVLELADAVVINKADGENKRPAAVTQTEMNRALHFLPPLSPHWQPQALTASALTGSGITELWQVVQRFQQQMQAAGAWQQRRQAQNREWLYALLDESLRAAFMTLPAVQAQLPALETAVANGTIPVTMAVAQLMALFQEKPDSPTPS